MPIYVYRCQECNEYTEALQKASDPLLKTCPHCQAEGLVKVIAPVGVIFKGTGFHKNDYSGKSGAASGSSKPAEGSDSKPAESKSEAPAASTSASSSDSGGGSGGGDTGPKPSGGDKVA
jgi:putative FmdB family regulatory protein